MKRFTLAAVAVIGAVCSIAFAGPAQAMGAADIAGHWMGFGQSSNLPAVQDSFFDVFADITPTKNRRFSIDLLLPAVQRVTIDGTISESGNVNIEGKGGGIHFNAHGKAIAMGDGSVRLAALQYHFDGGGLMDDGFILLLQAQGGSNWSKPPPQGDFPDVSGNWAGDYSSSTGPGGGAFDMDLRQIRMGGGANGGGTPTSAFSGGVHMGNVYVPAVQSFFDVFCDVFGTVGLPAVQGNGSMASDCALIGLLRPGQGGSPGIIAILIGLLLPAVQGNGVPAVQVNYALYGSFFDIFTEVWTGKMGSFDMGKARAVLSGK